MGGQAFSEYLSGYVIEKSLSIDNVFVWAVIFSSFAIPARYQHRVLFWGIFGALVMRAIFIFAGTALIERVLVDAPRVRCRAAVLRVQGAAAQGERGHTTVTTAR